MCSKGHTFEMIPPAEVRRSKVLASQAQQIRAEAQDRQKRARNTRVLAEEEREHSRNLQAKKRRLAL